MEIQKFEPIIRSLAKQYQINEIYTPEDVAQELRIKVLKVLPLLKDVPEKEIYGCIKTILKNRAHSLYYHQRYRPDTSPRMKESRMTVDGHNPVTDYSDGSVSNHHGSVGPNQYRTLQLKNVRVVIAKYLETADEVTKNFVSNLIEPSDEVVNAWKQRAAKSRRYMNMDTPPPHALRQILGVGNSKCSRIIYELRVHLNRHGIHGSEIPTSVQ